MAQWHPSVTTQVLTDSIIALAYFCLVGLLIRFLRRRRDIQFSWIFFVFCVFVLVRGVMHLAAIAGIWTPVEGLEAVTKGFTALCLSILIIAAFKVMPRLLKLPTPQQLQLAVDRFEGTFESAAMGLAHVALDGQFLLVNQELCRILGYTEAELLKSTSGDLNHPDDLAEARALGLSLLAGEITPYTAKKRYMHKQGMELWIQVTVSLVRDLGGKPSYFVVAFQEITEQREKELLIENTLTLLRQRDRQVNLLFEDGGIGDFTWNIQRDEVSAHPIVWNFYGYPGERGPQPSSWFAERQHPDDLPHITAHILTVLASPSARVDLEFRVIRPDASVRWLACRGTVLRDNAGNPIEVYGLNIDISARKIAQEAVRESERRMIALADLMPQLAWFNNPQGDVEFFNQRWYDYTGQDKNAALSWGWQAAIHPDDLTNLFNRWTHALATAQPHEAEFRMKAQDGSFRWFLGRGLPLRDENGNIERWFGTCTDIEDRKVFEARLVSFGQEMEQAVADRTHDLLVTNEALQEARTGLQAILDSATEVGIIALDRSGVIQAFNRGAERMLQYQAGEVLFRQTPRLYFSPEVYNERVTALQARLGRPVSLDEIFHVENLPSEPYNLETELVRRDGTRVMTSGHINPLLDRSGVRTGTLAVLLDITERTRLLADLNRLLSEKSADAENANGVKSEFLASMSHEIRTPMNAILGMADLLWETTLDSKQRNYLKVFRSAGANLLTLVNDVLDLSKIESGHFELELLDFDLRELIERTLELLEPKAKAKGLSLTASIDSRCRCGLRGDPSRLQQILVNLLGNAVKFTAKGSITLTVTADPVDVGRVLFEVKDTGVGIPTDKLQSIFQDFIQAESSATRRFGGRGMGLGICRRLVERMGGRLTVQSELGIGSTFLFDALFGQGSEPVSDPSAEHWQLAGRRVLIVDNNSTNRMIFSEMCRSWGMLVSECGNSFDVCEAVRKGMVSACDLLIIDRLMPVMDGFELAEFLYGASISVPVLLTTSDNIPGDETKAQRMGIAGYAVKPVRRSDLLRMVCKAVGTARVPERRLVTSEATAPRLTDGLPEHSAGGRILIAEDSEDNRFLMEAYLESSPYKVTYVENGEAAVKLALTQSFDLILMDIQMPIMDGLAATRQIRGAEERAGRGSIPVLALTANARGDDFEASRSAGCNAHLTKPISKDKLLRAIQHHLNADHFSA